MKDLFTGIAIIVFSIWAFCMWAYGVAVCWRADELFWAVVSFALAPLGFVIGFYNWVF